VPPANVAAAVGALAVATFAGGTDVEEVPQAARRERTTTTRMLPLYAARRRASPRRLRRWSMSEGPSAALRELLRRASRTR